MNKLFTLASCVSALFLLGCASAHQFVPLPDQTKTVADPTKGRIYVLRPSSFGYMIGMNVADGGTPIGSTGPHSFLCLEREPGDVIVSASGENSSRVALPVRPQSVHYILQNIRMGIWVARTDLEVLDEAKGKAELKHCKPAKVKPKP